MGSMTDVIAPANEEGTKATILKWCKSIGDSVQKDEPLLELETDKVTVEISSPASGTLAQILMLPDQEVAPGELLARVSAGDDVQDTDSGSAAAATASAPSIATKLTQMLRPGDVSPPPGTSKSPDALASSDARRSLSPSVRRLLAEHGLTPHEITGSGRNGRITAQDVTRYAEEVSASRIAVPQPIAPELTPAVQRAASRPVAAQVKSITGTSGMSTRVPHTPVRRRIAEHMARSLTEAPHVTTLFEADLTRVLAHRARHAADYESRGARLTLTAYFISACARALHAIPEVNATFHEDALELHADANIGVGTALGNKGLIVPVIHRAQGLNLFGLARRLGHVVEAARAGKLAPDDVRGGTFTISNHGVGGSLLAAPIVINQPQVAILGVGKVERRVCAVLVDGVESISVRSMCYLTLSIDHRALDAFQANAFLSLVVKTLEQWPIDES
jgi:2-oxoglutarate dehydrogenase E2 component (dihydrolipoamide succinyltransferase)